MLWTIRRRSDARLTALMAALFSFAHTVLAAPPPNDMRDQAAPLVISQTTTGTTVEATREVNDEPISASLTATVWYDWTAASTAPMELVLGFARPDGSPSAAALYVFREESGGALTLSASGSFALTTAGRFESKARFHPQAGVHYFIAVASAPAGVTSFDLALSVMTTRNAHDDFSAPLDFSGTTMTVSAALASLEPGEPDAFGNQASVWLRFTPAQGGWFSASCGYPCVLDVLRGTQLSTLTRGIAGVRLSFGSITIQPAAFVTFHADAGEAVYLRVLTNSDQNVTATVKPAVAGDHLADAIEAGAATTFTHTAPLGEMTLEAGESGGLRESFWVRWTAPVSAVFRASATTPPWVRSSGESGSLPEVRAFQGASIAGLAAAPAVPLGIVNQPCLLRAVAGQTYVFQAGITPAQFFSLATESATAPGVILTFGPTQMTFALEQLASPPNDDFISAHDFGGAVQAAMSGTTTGATNEPGEPLTTYEAGDSVWHRWTAPTTGLCELVLDDATALNLKIYSGSVIDALTYITEINSEWPQDYAPDPPPVRLRWQAVQNVVYHFRVGGRGYGGQGAYTLSLRQMSPPANDMRAAATALPSSHPLSITGTTVDASGESMISGDAGYYPERRSSVWWSWVAPESGWFRVAKDAGGADFTAGVMENGVIMGPDVNQITPLRFRATAGRTYHIRAGTSIDAEGVVNWLLQREPGFDHATSDSALDIGGASVVTTAPFQLPGGYAGYRSAGAASTSTMPGIWYRWTAPESGWVSFDSQGTVFVVALTVFSSAQADNMSLVAMQPNTNLGWLPQMPAQPAPPPVSRALGQVTAGQSYWIHLEQSGSWYSSVAPAGPVILRIRPALAPPAIISATLAETPPATPTRERFIDALVSVTTPNGFLNGKWLISGGTIFQQVSIEEHHRVSGDAFSGQYRVRIAVNNTLALTLNPSSIAFEDAMGGSAGSTSATSSLPLAAWSSDTQAPVLDAIISLPPAITLNGADVTVNLRLSIEDAGGSGFLEGAVFFQENADGSIIALGAAPGTRQWPLVKFDRAARISGDMHSGVYAVSLVIPANLPARAAGTLRLSLRDVAGNQLQTINGYYPNYAFSMPLNCVITQPGLTDSTPPLITPGAAAIEAPTMDAPHGRLRAAATVADAPSGFRDGIVELLNVDGIVERSWPFSSADRIAGDAFNGDFLIMRPLPAFGFGGEHYARLTVTDRSGMVNAVLLGPFTVTDRTAADTRAPALTSFSITPSSVDLMSGPAVISCALGVSDDEAGMSGEVVIRDSIGRLITSTPFSTGAASHVETLAINLPQWGDPGVSNQAEVSLIITDAAGRAQSYGLADSAPWPAGASPSLQIAPAPLTPFARLLADYPGLAPTLDSDADGDGLGDLIEVALGSDPLLATSADARAHRKPLAGIADFFEGSYFAFSFKPHPGFMRAAPAAYVLDGWTLRAQCSADLVTWQNLTLPDRDYTGFTRLYQSLSSPCFFRLSLTPPP